MRTFFSQVWAGSWMIFWCGIFALCGWWLLQKGWYLMNHQWELSGLALCALAFVPITTALHGLRLAFLLLVGRMSVRMARRQFRNGLADVIMYAKTGLWKE